MKCSNKKNICEGDRIISTKEYDELMHDVIVGKVESIKNMLNSENSLINIKTCDGKNKSVNEKWIIKNISKKSDDNIIMSKLQELIPEKTGEKLLPRIGKKKSKRGGRLLDIRF